MAASAVALREAAQLCGLPAGEMKGADTLQFPSITKVNKVLGRVWVQIMNSGAAQGWLALTEVEGVFMGQMGTLVTPFVVSRDGGEYACRVLPAISIHIKPDCVQLCHHPEMHVPHSFVVEEATWGQRGVPLPQRLIDVVANMVGLSASSLASVPITSASSFMEIKTAISTAQDQLPAEDQGALDQLWGVVCMTALPAVATTSSWLPVAYAQACLRVARVIQTLRFPDGADIPTPSPIPTVKHALPVISKMLAGRCSALPSTKTTLVHWQGWNATSPPCLLAEWAPTKEGLAHALITATFAQTEQQGGGDVAVRQWNRSMHRNVVWWAPTPHGLLLPDTSSGIQRGAQRMCLSLEGATHPLVVNAVITGSTGHISLLGKDALPIWMEQVQAACGVHKRLSGRGAGFSFGLNVAGWAKYAPRASSSRAPTPAAGAGETK